MRRALRALVLVAAVVPTLGPTRAEETGNVERVYELHHIDAFDVVMQIRASYPDSMKPGIKMIPAGKGSAFLEVSAPPAEQEAIARILAEKDVPTPSVTLQVILLDAMDAQLPAPELPGGASSALKDVRALFPFKGYRVRHTAVMPSSRRAGADLGGEFSMRVDARPGVSGSVDIPSFEVLKGNPNGGQTSLIGTSFSIRRGETVVLGTSLLPATAKVDSETPRALIVLVTALP